MSLDSSTDDFRRAMSDAGITPPSEIIPDGKLHRFSTNGRKGDKSGWYRRHPDEPASGAFGDWREGGKGDFHKWTARNPQTWTPEERAEYERRIEEAKAQRDAERQRDAKKARETAKRELDRAEPAAAHTYLTAKKIEPHGLKQDAQGRLLIPVKEITGELHSLQRIDAEGVKRFLPGGAISGNFATIGQRQKSGPVYVVEGWATGASVHEATGAAVVVAFNAGNLEPVVRAIREKSPEREIVICGDDDQWTDRNPGRTKAEAAAKRHGCKAIFPQFKALDGRPTDFNDLATREGLEAVKRQVEAADDGPTIELITFNDILDGDYPLEPLIDGLLNKKESLLICGQGGIGKSLFVNLLALSCADPPERGLFGLFPIHGPLSTLIIQSENTIAATKARLSRLIDAYPHLRHGAGRVFMPKIRGDCRMTGAVSDPEFKSRLVELIEVVNADLLFIDPLISFHGGEENDNAGMRRSLDALTEISDRTDTALTVMHHVGENHQTKTVFSGRGASSIGDWAGNILAFSNFYPNENQRKGKTPYIQVDHTKARNFEMMDSFYLERTPDLLLTRIDKPTTDQEAEVDAMLRILSGTFNGEVNTQSELIDATIEAMGCQRSKVQNLIKAALETHRLKKIPRGGKGNPTGLRLVS